MTPWLLIPPKGEGKKFLLRKVGGGGRCQERGYIKKLDVVMQSRIFYSSFSHGFNERGTFLEGLSIIIKHF